jgi:hypothetical protein
MEPREAEQALEEALRVLHGFVGGPEFSEELIKARQEFFSRVGTPLRGETFEEMRLASLSEWFIFDRPLPALGRTPAEEYLRLHADRLAPELAAALQGLTRSVHSVFVVKKRNERSAYLQDLYSGIKYKEAHRVPLTLGKRDLAELRLAAVAGVWVATDALCVHPYVARKAIARRLKEARKQGLAVEPLLFQLMALNTKFERSPRTAKAHVYDLP